MLGEKGESGVRVEILMALLVSSLLSVTGFVGFLVPFPIMLLNTRYDRKTVYRLLLLEFFIILVMKLFPFLQTDKGPLDILLLVFEMLSPAIMLIAGAIWIAVERKAATRKILLSLLPAIFFLLMVILYLWHDRALREDVTIYYLDAFGLMIRGLFSNLSDALVQNIANILLSVILMMILPYYSVAICVTGFLYEALEHSKESTWEDEVGALTVESGFIWAFISLWGFVLFSRFLSIPPLVGFAIVNLALTVSCLYLMQGFSVILYLLRKREIRIRAFPLFLILFLLFFIVPGLNIFVFLLVLILGLVENFVELRR